MRHAKTALPADRAENAPTCPACASVCVSLEMDSSVAAHRSGAVAVRQPQEHVRGGDALRVAVWHLQSDRVEARWSAWQAAGLDPRSLLDEHRLPAPRDAPAAILFWCPQRLTEFLPALRNCRARFPLTPLAVAIDCGRELDHLLAIEGGADEVLDVAWSVAVTAARLRGVRRRQAVSSPSVGPQQLSYGTLQMCRPTRYVSLDGAAIRLTACEFDLLWLLASHPGVPFDRSELLRQLREVDVPTGRRSIDTRVYRLRSKLGRKGLPATGLRTVRHRGYLFCAAGW